MAKRFWRGMIAGGIIGGILSNLLGSPLRKMETKELSKQVGRLKVQAEKVMNDAKDGVKGIYRKK